MHVAIYCTRLLELVAVALIGWQRAWFTFPLCLFFKASCSFFHAYINPFIRYVNPFFPFLMLTLSFVMLTLSYVKPFFKLL